MLCDQAQHFCVRFGILSVQYIGLDDYKSAYLGWSEVASHGVKCSPVGLYLHAFDRASDSPLNHDRDTEVGALLTTTDISHVLRVLQLPNRDGLRAKRAAAAVSRVAESRRSGRHRNI